MTRAQRDRLVTENLDLVDKIARAMLRHFPASIELDDLKQQGAVGLMQAAERFSKKFQRPGFKTPVNFRQYAKCRVRGAIIDANRRRHYREATHVSLEGDLLGAASLRANPTMDASIDSARLAITVNSVVRMLPRRERSVVQRYYGRGKTEPQIAREGGISTTQVGQVRRAAIVMLKRDLGARGIAKAA